MRDLSEFTSKPVDSSDLEVSGLNVCLAWISASGVGMVKESKCLSDYARKDDAFGRFC